MKLSAPIYRLKRQARTISREEGIPLHEALDRLAVAEGMSSWSLLAAKLAATTPAVKLYNQIQPGDLVLLGARPGQGKTLLSLELAMEAMKAGKPSKFFTLEYTEEECIGRFRALGVDLTHYGELFEFDGSDNICSVHVISKLTHAPRGTLVVIDYLQLLDQKRENPDLMNQVRALRSFAKDRGITMVFVSQIDRSYDPLKKPFPDLSDVRLPNPLDLKLFDKAFFLNDGEIRF